MSKVKLSSLKVDLSAEREGDWVRSSIDGVEFKVRGLQHPAYQIEQRKWLRQLAQQNRQNADVSPDEIYKVTTKMLMTHILIDWRGMDVPCSEDLKREVAEDPSYRDVVRAIEECAAKVGQSQIEMVEDDTKN